MSHEKGIEAAGLAIDNYVQDYCYGDIGEKRFAEKVIKAYLDASGMVMVPREPTKEMIEVGNSKIEECVDFWNYDSGSGYLVESFAANRTFEVMISAAPSPFQTPEESREKK